ncbi:MAG: DUF1667 domain-containing protein [Clostridiaceae bacterium]|nr:DUF1667 domain-containing protein [Clostridiaceae bacterium]
MRELTCIVCPTGCRLRVDIDTLTVTGNQCKRGLKYGLEELTAPRRTVTSTVRILHQQSDSQVLSSYVDSSLQSNSSKPLVNNFFPDSDCIEGRLPVKTREDIPKDKIESVMQEINQCVVKSPVHLGDIIVENIADTGVALVATRTILKL